MRTYSFVALAAILGSVPANAQTATDAASGLAWLAGCWVGGSGTRVIEEQWMRGRGGLMLGSARTSAGDAVRDIEFNELHVKGDSVRYIALPAGQQRTEFKGRMTGPRSFVVENLANDFPTHLGYELVTRDSLSAWIEGMEGGVKRRIPYAYRRTACEDPG